MSRASPLPDGWTESEAFLDVVVADGVEIRRAGLSATGPGGIEVNGAAAELAGDPEPRARFELLERIATVEAIQARRQTFELMHLDGSWVGSIDASDVFPESDEPERWRPARSNGVALHVDRRGACERAAWELAERDAVLRTWLGERRPEALEPRGVASLLASAPSYVVRVARLSSGDDELQVTGVFGFPRSPTAPFVMGYAARPRLDEAIDVAARECLQQLAFLWDEPIPAAPPTPGPSASHHLEHWLYPGHHRILGRWLDDGHRPFGRRRKAFDSRDLRYIDLTPAAYLGRLVVVKAIAKSALSLVFGSPPAVRRLPRSLQVHPVS